MKKLLSLLIVPVLIFGLAGCGETEAQAPQASSFESAVSEEASAAEEPAEQDSASGINWAQGNPVPEGSQSFYLPVNNLEFEQIDVSEKDGMYNGSYYRISGLKDTELQAQINKQIKDLFDEMMDIDYIAPYRGIKLKLRAFEGETPQGIWVGMSYCSCGNILSINCYVSKDYSNYEEGVNEDNFDSMYFTDCQTLNIDLNTGKPVRFTDLFSDNIDALEYCNSYINSYINENDCLSDRPYSEYAEEIVLCSEFTGIEEDHKYYINSYSGDICFVFDYNDPEFVTDCYYCTISVPLGEYSALAKRFAGDNLYLDDSPNYKLLSNPFDIADAIDISEYIEDENNPNHSFSTYITSYSSMPKAQRDYLRPMFDNPEDAFAFLDEKEAEARELYNFTESQGYASCSGYVGRYGDYTTISVYNSAYIHDPETWETLYQYSDENIYCFRGDSSTPMTFSDVFASGVNYPELIAEAMLCNAKADYPYAIEYAGEENAKEFFNYVVDHIRGFDISDSSLSLVFDENLADMAAEFYPDDNIYQPCSCCNYVRYKDLGFENLALFE